MAKRGDECFFSALVKLGILPEVLANRIQYHKDFAAAAREHGHDQLATTIATSPRYNRIVKPGFYSSHLS